MGESVYGIIESGVFGCRIISGIITGIRYTETDPVYEISFGQNKWWTSQIATNQDTLIEMLNLPTLERISQTHGLLIKYQ